MPAEVEIVGAVDPEAACGRDTVTALLALPAQPLDHDSAFTGRPTTIVRATSRHVLKERDASAMASTLSELRYLAEETLERERLYGIYPPAKTWFIARTEQGLRLGNVTPRLSPLHLPEAEEDPSRFFRHLRTMLQMYIRIAARFRVRLDEGLSNFASDEQDRLHYIDDDIYVWDDFGHFSQSVGVTIRKVKTLSPKFAQALGQAVRQSIVAGFGDAGACRRIADSVRGLYFNGAHQEQRRDGFVDGLLGATPHSRSRRAVAQHRPFALLADVHANLPALSAVMDALRDQGVEHGIVLGDIVGYGPHPRECLRIIRDAGFEIVRGNHDQAAATGIRPPGFNEVAFKVIEWTRTQLDASELAWLGEQPTRIERDGWMAQHGAPMDPSFFNAYVYRLTYEDNLDYLAEQGLRWAFHGHTHTPSVFFATQQSCGLDESRLQSLADYQQALVCPGSVGQPRRGGIEAQWAIFNPATTQIEFFSIPYDVEVTVSDMVARQFPSALIERLRAGT